MTVQHVKYLLVGGGVASSVAAKTLRLADPDGIMMLVGQEVHRPYFRPELSRRFLRREWSREQLYLDDPQWFVQQRITLRTARRVVRLEPSRSAVTLDSGEEISYDQLLIATGALPNELDLPGARLPNLYYLRTLDDAERLRHAVEKAHREGRIHESAALPAGRGKAVVIGGGLLGAEVAASLKQLGLAVDLVGGRPHPWGRQAGDATGRFISTLLAANGVSVMNGRRASALEGDGRVQRVRLDDGSLLACDFAVACVGAHANKELLRGTTIAAGKTILVDAFGRTSVPNIFAAGDCCSILDPRFGKHRWLEHWDGALATAGLAGGNMAAATGAAGTTPQPFTALPGFETEVFGVMARGWGEPRLVDRRLIRGSTAADSPGFAEIGVGADGRVTQVLLVGDVPDAETLRQLVMSRVATSGLEDSLRDPSVPISGS